MGPDRGVSESAQWTMLTPLILVLVLGVIQLGLWGYARVVVLNSAVAAAEEASLEGAPAGAGASVARTIAARGGLADVRVTVTQGSGFASAEVSGRMPALVDVGLTRVDAQVTRPRERVTRP